MAKHESFTILPLEYFSFGNKFSGSEGEFNYKITPDTENFHLIVWYGKLCSAKSETVASADFPLAEESRSEICQWLDEQYQLFLRWQRKQTSEQ